MTTDLQLETIAKAKNLPIELVRKITKQAQIGVTPLTRFISVKEGNISKTLKVTRKGVGTITTPFGDFWFVTFSIDDNWVQYNAIIKCDMDEDLNPIFQQKEILVRTDSGCETGQVFHDRTCDCREQLHQAMKDISNKGEGLIVNIPKQDGRGMGLAFKLSTLLLQDKLGMDTVESASFLAKGNQIDTRTYSGVIAVLKFFGIPDNSEFSLVTNNPKKASIFAENNFLLSGLKPVVIKPNVYTEKHLKAKQEHLGHVNLIDSSL